MCFLTSRTPQRAALELMTKLITNTPEKRIPFLIDHFQSKQGNCGQLQKPYPDLQLFGQKAKYQNIKEPEEISEAMISLSD